MTRPHVSRCRLIGGTCDAAACLYQMTAHFTNQAKMQRGSGDHEGGSCSGKSMRDNRTKCRVRKFPAASASAAHARRGPAAVSFHPLSQRAEMPAAVRVKDESQKHKAAFANAWNHRWYDAARRQDRRRRASDPGYILAAGGGCSFRTAPPPRTHCLIIEIPQPYYWNTRNLAPRTLSRS